MSKIQFVGNLTAEPELSYGKEKGTPVAYLRVAENTDEKVGDGQYRARPTIFRNVKVFKAQAENIAESLHTGHHVLVIGTERSRSYRPDGATEDVTVVEVIADFVAPTLLYGTTTFTKTARKSHEAAATEYPDYDEADTPPAQ